MIPEWDYIKLRFYQTAIILELDYTRVRFYQTEIIPDWDYWEYTTGEIIEIIYTGEILKLYEDWDYSNWV